jgi:hypothetical protein
MSEDGMLKCLIAFILGFLIFRMIRGNGLSVGGQYMRGNNTFGYDDIGNRYWVDAVGPGQYWLCSSPGAVEGQRGAQPLRHSGAGSASASKEFVTYQYNHRNMGALPGECVGPDHPYTFTNTVTDRDMTVPSFSDFVNGTFDGGCCSSSHQPDQPCMGAPLCSVVNTAPTPTPPMPTPPMPTPTPTPTPTPPTPTPPTRPMPTSTRARSAPRGR